MELAFVYMGKKSVSTESAEYFLDVGFVLKDVVGVDEDFIQIDDDNEVNHIHEDLIHELLKSCWSISKPFRHYQPLEGTITGLEGSFPLVSGCNPNKMVSMPEVNFGVESCFSWCF